ncbi:metallophosphoesterase [Allokutzneria sp. A3M-2-11 16]|uniref:metallophosphoesterase n=1 Tax=Allokutzneria sp. A3M-2-11 16 TaxID=2962043 RepID=UPI0020B69D6B|nr:metallophosphoesterase [Allokutzneria sp. A3M-2-11 16]MCP3799841.1 metallophosphoesterase [Allokutzneria sp. A3M-2-11 16]
MNTFGRILLGTTALGAATVGYAAGVERLRFTLRHATLPVLPENARPLRILHISDLHMTPNQLKKQRWVADLARLEPDLVINTGDNLAHAKAVPTVMRALGPLLDFPGMFVFGSNDYFAPKPKNPFRYLIPAHKAKRVHGTSLPWRDLRAAMTERGWQDLTHLRHTATVAGVTVTAAGVDDPHLKRDRYEKIAGKPGPQTQLSIGVTHSPEPRILDAFAQDDYDLVLAGHTHGGQLCVPFYGALVTNCGLDRKRVKGPSRWGDRTWLHVSAGLGTSPYAPVRFACLPEASLLTLVPRSEEAAAKDSDAQAPTRFGAGVDMR